MQITNMLFNDVDWHTTPESLQNSHPGNILKEEYLPDLGMTEYQFAKRLGITQTHLAGILTGHRNITANIALRLGKLFGQTPEMWLRLQNQYDLEKARMEYGEQIHKIEPIENTAVREVTPA